MLIPKWVNGSADTVITGYVEQAGREAVGLPPCSWQIFTKNLFSYHFLDMSRQILKCSNEGFLDFGYLFFSAVEYLLSFLALFLRIVSKKFSEKVRKEKKTGN